MIQILINESGTELTINASSGVNVTVNAAPPVTPKLGTPGSLIATAISTSQIDVSWAAVENATTYVLYRSPNGVDTWTSIYTSSTPSYSNSSLPADTTYYYYVIAQGAGYLDSDPSTTASATTQSSLVDSPVIYRMATTTVGDKVSILFNKAMSDPTGKHGQFSWKQNGTARTFTAASLNGPNKLELTCSNTIVTGDEVLITYTPGTVVSSDGGNLLTFGNAPVLNTVLTTDIPFFDNWDFLIDARNNSKITLSGTNVLAVEDIVATKRYSRVQSTGYVTLDDANNAFVIDNTVSNEYITDFEIRKPASGRFTYFFKFKTPPSSASTATQPIYFLRHSTNGHVILSNHNTSTGRRNMRAFTTFDYYSTSIGQSGITNNDSWYYVVVSYDGTTYKMWSNGNYVPRSVTISSVEQFNRIFQGTSTTSRAPHSIRIHGIGEYLSDSDITTLNSFLSTV